jgi:predicted dithiol-disulfide oxidoreductase (DUF899 family)
MAMKKHKVVSHAEWTRARKALLAKEKAFTRRRDALSRTRRELPWERAEKSYTFEGPNGKETLADLFDGRSQLVVYHFMFDPAWDAGCKSCSFWADNFDGNVVHLAHRDVTLVAISRAPLERLQAFQRRMGWRFKWLSSFGTDFNYDYHVSFTPEEQASGKELYNYERQDLSEPEMPGISVFFKDPGGSVFHTYSCYSRGLDMLNAGYHYLDLVPKGRDEAKLSFAQEWVRHHDSYKPAILGGRLKPSR